MNSKESKMSFLLDLLIEMNLYEIVFFNIMHVKDTTALILKEEIFSVLFHHDLDI